MNDRFDMACCYVVRPDSSSATFEFLQLRRSPGKYLAGAWSTVRGKIESTVTRRTLSTPAPDRPELRLAAIDVGSNSLHMVIAQADPDGAVTTLWRMKEMVGLGRISFPSHRLTKEAMDRAAGTLSRFQQVAKIRGCEKIIAVATSAVREAENGGDFLVRVRRELGIPLRVVSARDE